MNEAKYAYLSASTPGAVNDATPYRPGLLGQTLLFRGKKYMYVLVDSGAAPAPANGLLVFWKTKSAFTVTTKLADSKENQLAGVLAGAPTVGQYTWVLLRGSHSAVVFGGAAPAAAGDYIVPKAGSAAADADKVAAGTAPTYATVGLATAASGGGTVACDVDIAEIDA